MGCYYIRIVLCWFRRLWERQPRWQLSGPLLQTTTTTCSESEMMNMIAYAISKRQTDLDYAVIEIPVSDRPGVFSVKIAYKLGNSVRLWSNIERSYRQGDAGVMEVVTTEPGKSEPLFEFPTWAEFLNLSKAVLRSHVVTAREL
jgi:hypothetical protein